MIKNSFLRKIKKINYKHYIMIACILASLGCSVFIFPFVFIRTLESFRDIGTSFAYYFCNLFDLSINFNATVIFIPKGTTSSILPYNFDEFKILFNSFIKLLFNGSNIINFFNQIFNNIYYILMFFTVFIPLIFVIFFLLKQQLKKENNDYNQDTKQLKIYKNFENKVIYPIKNLIKNFILFNQKHSYYVKIIFWIWFYNFNFVTIIIEFFAFYFYFISTFDLLRLYTQFVKLFIDISVVIRFMPTFMWFVIFIIVLNILRARKGYSRLRHFEQCNRGFVTELGVCTLVVGRMRAKKTTIITDMSLSIEAVFRDKAYELLVENDMKFPNFPWINLENEIKKQIMLGTIYNLATCKLWVKKRKERFYFNPSREKCFDYDYMKYGLKYDDKLCVIDLFDVISNYVRLYFIYIVDSSLTVSNYSIRNDNYKMDKNNFPLWNNDFFNRESFDSVSKGKFSHILDFDILRLGKKVIENNKKAGSFEFGNIAITEVGKERGNMVENKDVKSDSDNANPKNDLFNKELKMIAHGALVNYYTFVKVFMDEQRPESLGADARELTQIVHIEKTNPLKLLMPWFFIEELIESFLMSKFERLYQEHRFNRGDNTLFIYLVKKVTTKFNKYYKGIYNTFGSTAINVSVEDGTLDSNKKKSIYYLQNKKIYSERFSSDCFSDYFNEMALNTKSSLDSYETYESVKATFKELGGQDSYFMMDLLGIDWRKSVK